MTPTEAIQCLEELQRESYDDKNTLGNVAEMIRSARFLIAHIGTTGVERTDIIKKADDWLRE